VIKGVKFVIQRNEIFVEDFIVTADFDDDEPSQAYFNGN
jgi:hypothetical protein